MKNLPNFTIQKYEKIFCEKMFIMAALIKLVQWLSKDWELEITNKQQQTYKELDLIRLKA